MGPLLARPAPTCGQWKCKNPNCQNAIDDKISLQLLLVGKCGAGKSSTGNFLLGDQRFPTSGGFRPKTRKEDVSCKQHGCYKIKVVDGPDFTEAEMKTEGGRENVVRNMKEALSLFDGGLNVILLVMRLGDRFTPEMKQAISDFEMSFGEDYLKERVIIVVTGGDIFDDMMKNDGTPGTTFKDWIQSGEQDGDFRKLVKECGSRIVLFNNFAKEKAKIDAQIDNLFKYADKLRKKESYTSEHFASQEERQKKINLSVGVETLPCFPQNQLLKDDPQSQLMKDGPHSQLMKDGPQSQLLKDGTQSQLMKDGPQSQLMKDGLLPVDNNK